LYVAQTGQIVCVKKICEMRIDANARVCAEWTRVFYTVVIVVDNFIYYLERRCVWPFSIVGLHPIEGTNIGLVRWGRVKIYLNLTLS